MQWSHTSRETERNNSSLESTYLLKIHHPTPNWESQTCGDDGDGGGGANGGSFLIAERERDRMDKRNVRAARPVCRLFYDGKPRQFGGKACSSTAQFQDLSTADSINYNEVQQRGSRSDTATW